MNKKENISTSQWIYFMLMSVLLFITLFGTFKIVEEINKGNTFKPDFKFQYWEAYKNPSCEFNSDNSEYIKMCEELIEAVINE